MRRYRLRDDQWDLIKGLLPGREGSVGVTAADNRRFAEAVLYCYRAGIPWRDLPERFGDWKKVHRRFSRCLKVAHNDIPYRVAVHDQKLEVFLEQQHYR